MPITVDQFRDVLPGGNFFSDPRLPAGSRSSGPIYTPPVRPGGGVTGTSGTGNTGAPTLPNYSDIDNLIAQINAGNQQAQTSALNNRIPGAAQLQQDSSRNISGFLNPPAQYGEIDVPAASRAVASGTVGSPFAGVTGLNLTREQQQQDMIRGEQLLTGALARNPAAPIADPMQLLHLLTQLQESARGREFTAHENALQRSLQAQLGLLNAQGRYHGGGNNYGPHLPTQYGRPGAPTSSTNIPAFTDYGGAAAGGGTGSLFSFETPENFGSLSPQQQAQYSTAVEGNPYYGLPDYANPYEDLLNPYE